MSYNAWLYVYANPINLTDPSGHDPWWCEDSQRYPTKEDREKRYADAFDGWQYGTNPPKVNLVLLCGTDMIDACQGNYKNYQGEMPLSPAKDWAISKGFSYEYHGTKGIATEPKANAIADGMAFRSRVWNTKHIVIGFSGGASFSTLVSLRAVQSDAVVLLVIQMDSQMKNQLNDNPTNTTDNYNELSRDYEIPVYGCNSEAYEEGYLRFEGKAKKHFWNDDNDIYERPPYSTLVPGVMTHYELAYRQDIFDTYIKPELERAVQGLL